MKVLLTTLNAKYFHTNYALRCLAAYCPQFAESFRIKEYTINTDEDAVLSGIYHENPHIICFSCYIWNIAATLSLVGNLKKVLPGVTIILGGPEVSYNGAEILSAHPADVVVSGEGEFVFARLMDHYIAGKGELTDIPNLIFRDGSQTVTTGARDCAVALDEIPFVYSGGHETDKLVYFETSRGCPFQCAYCLSGSDCNVRFLSPDRCFEALDYFLEQNVRRVKFIDRTFNCRKPHAMDIWRYLITHDNGVTNFHFELAGDLIDDDMLALIQTARKGLFQFEIGVQSTNERTLAEITRKTNLERLFQNVRTVAGFGNAHQHLDLIAGLPYEDMTSFEKSFNDVYGLNPDQLQLGFLKLLHGSVIRRRVDEYGIVYKNDAPYDVLFTRDLSYEDIIKLKRIEQLLEMYYNSNKCRQSFSYAVKFFASPFRFYSKFAGYWDAKGYHDVSHNKMKLYDIAFEFLDTYFANASMEIERRATRDLLVFDMFINDRVVNRPGWAPEDLPETRRLMFRRAIRDFPGNENNRLSRKLHIEAFDFDVVAWSRGGSETIEARDNFVLFDYTGGTCRYDYIMN